jgi:preprotein translocase subunit SecA
MSELAIKMGAPRGAYPERPQVQFGWLDRAANRVDGGFRHLRRTLYSGHGEFVRAVNAYGPWAAQLSDVEIRETASALGAELRRRQFPSDLVAKCFSLTREAAGRTLGQRHFDVQLIAGRVILRGMVAEMDTGEGKTLTATLAAAAAALAGYPVHVITVNDYLADRDARWMAPVYSLLGLRVGTIVHGLTPEERRDAYAADVAYCTNKELAFDYLKDRIVLGNESARARLQVERLYQARPRMSQMLLRGLIFGIVDEADSVLIDEARTPLIISGAKEAGVGDREIYRVALSLASEMQAGRDYAIEGQERSMRLLPSALSRLEEVADSLGGIWARRSWREDLVRQALVAQHLFLNGKQYLVHDGKVQIVDEYSGRVMADRSWEFGLHQMIEVKEGCQVTGRNEPLARISYQKFFRRYLWLAGMTGTAAEVRSELWSVYRLATMRIPTNRPSRRRHESGQVYSSQQEKWQAVLSRVLEVHNSGRPVLVGTRSVEDSETVSRLLRERGLEHSLLNARQDAQEAEIVSQAGGRKRITVATNMAARGTDIKLGEGVAELGGLHVIATELHDARRIDRQLFGRCARQGDPGSCEAITSLEDEIVRVYARTLVRRFGGAAVQGAWRGSAKARGWLMREAQRSAERLHLRSRRDLLKFEEQLESKLAFSGSSE